MEYIAFSRESHPFTVDLICRKKREYPTGKITFEVINGLWDGSFLPDEDSNHGTLTVNYTKREIRVIKLFEGFLKHEWFESEYNEMIQDVQETLDKERLQLVETP